VSRGYDPRPAAHGVSQGTGIVFAADLVRHDHLRRHSTEHPGYCRRFGAAVHHIRSHTYIQRGQTHVTGGQLVPLVGNAHAQSPIGKLTGNVPQHRGLAHARR
jgi:hypothetical protein